MESIKIKLLPGAKKPKRATDDAIGYDVFAYQVNKERKGYPLPYILNPRQRVLIGVGFFIKVPEKTDCQVRPRSGLSIKYGIQVLNGPGTLDPDYMGEAGVILHNTSNKPFEIKKDMRIAQLIFSKVELPVLLEVDSISKKTRRGEGGFGSTGVYDIEIGTTEYDREVKKQDIFFEEMVWSPKVANLIRGSYSCRIARRRRREVLCCGANAHNRYEMPVLRRGGGRHSYRSVVALAGA